VPKRRQEAEAAGWCERLPLGSHGAHRRLRHAQRMEGMVSGATWFPFLSGKIQGMVGLTHAPRARTPSLLCTCPHSGAPMDVQRDEPSFISHSFTWKKHGNSGAAGEALTTRGPRNVSRQGGTNSCDPHVWMIGSADEEQDSPPAWASNPKAQSHGMKGAVS
jgi:hypothetical protein